MRASEVLSHIELEEFKAHVIGAIFIGYINNKPTQLVKIDEDTVEIYYHTKAERMEAKLDLLLKQQETIINLLTEVWSKI